MFVPSPNLLDYLIWAAQRTDAGTDDDIYYYDDWDADIIVEASWTIQTVLDGVIAQHSLAIDTTHFQKIVSGR